MVDEIGRELFQSRNIVDENNNEHTMENFKKYLKGQLDNLRSYFDLQNTYTYPSAYEYEQIKKYLEVIVQTSDVEDFFIQSKNIAMNYSTGLKHMIKLKISTSKIVLRKNLGECTR